MQTKIEGGPTFAYVHVDLEPGESIIAESDAMASMDADLSMEAKFNGGFVSGVLKNVLGGESLFVNHFTNTTRESRRVTFVQGTPGDIRQVELNGQSICLQPGAYVASTPGLTLGVDFAGFASGFAREGFFKLVVSGQGTLWYGAYGALLEKDVDGAYIVDTSHLVAYDPQLTLHPQLSGGIFSSFFGGEGFVTRIEGRGKIIVQTRSIGGLTSWLNPKLGG